MSNYKIKTVKEFIKEGSPQFDVILRRDVGKIIDVSFIMCGRRVDKTLSPPENGQGIIYSVKRISDDVVFNQSDLAGVGIESSVIIEFQEDLIHVSIATLFEQETTLVEINKLTPHPSVDDDILEEDEGEN